MRNTLYILLLLSFRVWSQPISAPIHSQATYLTDRLLIKTGVPSAIHSDIKGYSVRDIGEYTDRLWQFSDSLHLSSLTRSDLQYLSNEVNEWSKMGRTVKRPLLRYFFRTPAYLFEIKRLHNYITTSIT